MGDVSVRVNVVPLWVVQGKSTHAWMTNPFPHCRNHKTADPCYR